MKKLYIIIFIIILTGFGYFLLKDNQFQEMDLKIEFIPNEGIESEEIRILNDIDEIVFQLTLEELNQWTEENWNIFEEMPEVGGRIVNPAGFGFFDRAASISHDNKKMVFTVSDYALATTVSFIIIVDTESGEMGMINKLKMGNIEEFIWSEDSKLIAYTLGTGRAGGDFLSVDNAKELEEKFILREGDILEVLDPYEELVMVGQFMPLFRNLEWSEDRLYFTTNYLENGQVRWSINKDGRDLKKEFVID